MSAIEKVNNSGLELAEKNTLKGLMVQNLTLRQQIADDPAVDDTLLRAYIQGPADSGSLANSFSPMRRINDAFQKEIVKINSNLEQVNKTVHSISDRLHSGLKGPRTRSEWVKKLIDNSHLSVDPNFFTSFNEVRACTAEFDKLIKGGTVLDFNFSVKVSEEPKKGMGSREHFGRVIQQVINLEALQRRHDCSSRNKDTVGSHKPDYCERALEAAGEQSIIVLGEIKGILDADKEFSDEDSGQILDFVQELLLKQGWRQWAFGFITDGVRFEFFKGLRGADGINFFRSGLISKGSGWLHLSQLLQQKDSILGFKLITITGWDLGDWFGTGSTSSVFGIMSNDKKTAAVCKIFTNADSQEAERCRDNELRALNILSDDPHSPMVASNLKKSDGENPFCILIVTPRGETIGENGIRLPICTYAPLVDTLIKSHRSNICHLDICGENMYAVKNEDLSKYLVILNDWSSSMTIEEINKAEKFSTRKLYYNVSNMGPAEDLMALVRSVFFLTQCTFPVVESSQELDAQMRSQWSWGEALDRAFNKDYDAVRQFFLTGSVKTPVNTLTASFAEHEFFKSSGEEADFPELESSVG